MKMIFIAGEAVWNQLVAEKEATIPRSTVPGREDCFQSGPLCRLQSEQYNRGFLGVELVQSLFGWSVRYDTGLKNFDIAASARHGEVDGTYSAAVAFAETWVEGDPDHRYAWVRA